MKALNSDITIILISMKLILVIYFTYNPFICMRGLPIIHCSVILLNHRPGAVQVKPILAANTLFDQ